MPLLAGWKLVKPPLWSLRSPLWAPRRLGVVTIPLTLRRPLRAILGPLRTMGVRNPLKVILAGMTDVELKQYASLLGIKTKGLKTKEELMEAIKAHQE